jgi:hypothetical protein
MGLRTSPEILNWSRPKAPSLDAPSPRLYTHLIRSFFPERLASEGLPDRGRGVHLMSSGKMGKTAARNVSRPADAL